MATSAIAAYVSLEFRNEDDRLQAITQSLDANNGERLRKFIKAAEDEYEALEVAGKEMFYSKSEDLLDEKQRNIQMASLARMRMSMHTLAKLDKIEKKDSGNNNEVINGPASKSAGLHKFKAKIEPKFLENSSHFYDAKTEEKMYVPKTIRLPGLIKIYEEHELEKLAFDPSIKIVVSKDKKSGKPTSIQVRPS